MCRKGNESKKATEKILKETEFVNVYNVEGGLEEITREIDADLPSYWEIVA